MIPFAAARHTGDAGMSVFAALANPAELAADWFLHPPWMLVVVLLVTLMAMQAQLPPQGRRGSAT